MTREETPQRANRKVMAVVSQSITDLGQSQIIFLCYEGMNTLRLRLDPNPRHAPWPQDCQWKQQERTSERHSPD
ncbi:hypothetical protein ABUE34_15215 (plasmid) [Kozakia baliensis]